MNQACRHHRHHHPHRPHRPHHRQEKTLIFDNQNCGNGCLILR